MIVLIKKKKILAIKEKKLWLYLKKPIKRYQIFQPHMKKTLTLCILVEYLHLAICQNLLIHPSFLHILMKRKIIKVCTVHVLYNILELLFFKLLMFIVSIDFQDPQIDDLEVSSSLQLK